MRELRCPIALCLVACCALLSGACVQANPDAPNVEFGPKAVLGRWQAIDEAPLAGSVAVVEPVAPVVPNAGQPGVVPVAGISPGSAGTAPVASPVPMRAGTGAVSVAVGGAGASGMAGAATGGRGGAGGSAGTIPAQSVVTSLAFDVTTVTQSGRYQPRNIGAIWIQDATGRFIKSLEVWAGIRARYLTKYNAARSGMAVDVVTSATLLSHRAHHATWNLKDRSGATVPPGKYTLFIELTDADITGKFTSVEFDLGLGPQVFNPPNAQYYTNMKLQLQ